MVWKKPVWVDMVENRLIVWDNSQMDMGNRVQQIQRSDWENLWFKDISQLRWKEVKKSQQKPMA